MTHLVNGSKNTLRMAATSGLASHKRSFLRATGHRPDNTEKAVEGISKQSLVTDLSIRKLEARF